MPQFNKFSDEITSKYLERKQGLLNNFHRSVQEHFEKFYKERISHFDWLDQKYSVPNDLSEGDEFYETLKERCLNRDTKYSVDEEGLIETTILQSVELLFAICLSELGLSDSKVIFYLDIFQKKFSRHGRCSVLKFYYSLVLKGLSVNIYLAQDDIYIKSIYEYDMLSQENMTLMKMPMVVLSLNQFLTIQFEDDFFHTKEFKHYLSDSEMDVIQEIRGNEFKKDEIIVKLKKGSIDLISVLGKEDDLNKLKELSEKYPESKIGFQQYKGKKQYISIETRKKYRK